MADAWHIARRDRYISLNPIDDYQGRVVNIEEHFGNLPYRLCIPLQWMNESISKADWKHFMQCKRIESLNDSMVHLYEVNMLCFQPFFSPLVCVYLLITSIFISIECGHYEPDLYSNL